MGCQDCDRVITLVRLLEFGGLYIGDRFFVIIRICGMVRLFVGCGC